MLSTRRQSLDATNIRDMYQHIEDAIRVFPYPSRSEIAITTGFRLSSVCGRVNELLKAGKIRVYGTKIDHATNRTVETLTLTA